MRPDRAGPHDMHPPLGRPIGRRVERPEPLAESRRIERRAQEGLDEARFGFRVHRQPVQQEPLALDRRREAGVAGPFDAFLMVGGNGGSGHDRLAIRREIERGHLSRSVQNRHVVAHVTGDAGQGARRLVRRLAGLQDVAQDQGHAEPLAHCLATTKGQRNGEARAIDAVQQAPKTVRHAHDRPIKEFRPEDHAIEGRGGVIVIAHQKRQWSLPYGLAAPGKVWRRAPERQEARGIVPASAHLFAKRVVQVQKLRHVACQGRAAFPIGRARGQALARPPAAPGGPVVPKQGRQLVAGTILRDRAENQ